MSDSLTKKLGQTVLLGSGAIGTCLRQKAARSDEPVELLNLRDPQTVRHLHTAYRNAGSQILVTNTFASNAVVFGDINAADLCDEINRRAVELAREAADGQCLIWASVGPLGLGLRLEDYSDEDLFDVYRRQCLALKDADALLLETFVDPREARAAIAAACQTGLPVIFQIGNVGGGPARWNRVDQLLREARREGVVAVGANCSFPDDIERLVAYLLAHTSLPVTVSPNAGRPRIERGVVRYEYSPKDFAGLVGKFADVGAAVIGGCCGTTPEHIREAAAALGVRPVRSRPCVSIGAPRAEVVVERQARAENVVRNLMKSSPFLVSVEIRADRHQTLADIVRGAAQVAQAGADLFDVPDNAGATVGRDAIVTAARLQKELRIPSLFHFSVTQSNLMRLHSTLLGGWDLGLQGLLAVTGDAPSMGHLGNLAHRITDMRSSVELLRLIRNLREGRIINGEGLADPPDFCAGCAVARPIPAQIRWLEKKIEAGAEFVFSQPVFTFDDYCRLRDALSDLPIRFFPGLMPLVSLRNAQVMASGRIPGIVVPEEVVADFSRFESVDDQRRHGLASATQLACKIAQEASGLYTIMPFGKRCYEEAAAIVRAVKSTRADFTP